MIYLGTSGWYYEDWIGKFYPTNLKKNKWLNYYSEKLNTVEVNASFYRLPFKNMVKGWKNKTPDNFLLSFKGSQMITHKKKLKDIDDYLEKFYNRVEIAEKKIGVILWQMPPYLKKDIKRLECFLTKLNPNYRQSVEFRHRSWFDKKIYNILDKYNIAFCVISSPSLPTNMVVTADFAYIRWHGLNYWYKHYYSVDELEGWAKYINNLDVNDVFGYFNNDFNAFAPKNCLKLKEILMKKKEVF